MVDAAGHQASAPRLRMELRVVIRRARERLQLSQADFAAALGKHLGHPISQSQISDWERGRFEPGAGVLLAIAELADVSIDELRIAGPPAILRRIEHLEDEVDRLGRAESPDDESARAEDRGSPMARITAIEEEIERIGGLLARMIEVMDKEGFWPSADADPESSDTSGEAGRQRSRAASDR